MFVAACSDTTTSAKCTKYKNGNFLYRFVRDGKEYRHIIQRQDTAQIETEKSTGYRAHYRVNWVNECTCELYLLSTTFPSSDSSINERKKIPLRVQIMHGTNNYYLFRAQRSNSPVLTDTMWVEK
ncbi:MAG: hypothetical protein IM638_10680 [Bacteroidetes bacterium]|nr:hypothetical protein [Bacteroidota bacterium]